MFIDDENAGLHDTIPTETGRVCSLHINHLCSIYLTDMQHKGLYLLLGLNFKLLKHFAETDSHLEQVDLQSGHLHYGMIYCLY